MYNFYKRLFLEVHPMIFSLRREELVEVLSDFNNILKDNPIKPVIAGLKIQAIGDQVIFTGTNLEVNFIRTIGGEILKEGVVVIKHLLVLEYVKLLENEIIHFSLDEDRLNIHHAEFSILDAEQYPDIKELSCEEIVKIQGKEFVSYLDKVKFSAAISNDNIGINCIRIIFNSEDGISFASTDSYRLTYLKTERNSLIQKEISIPLESVNIVCKLMKDLEDEVVIGLNGNTLIFKWNNIYFATKTIDLSFPNFKAILESNSFSKEIEFNTKELKSALKKVLTVAKTSIETRNGALFEFKNKHLIMSAYSGRAKINQKVDIIKIGEDFKCSLNARYLYEFIDNISENTILKGNSSSAMFEISEFGNNSYKYVLMPLALRD